VNLAVHFIRARSNLSCFSVPFLYYATCWSGEGKEENCEWEEGGEVEEIG